MSIWDKMIGCEKNAHLFPIKMTSNIQSMYEFPRFSKSSSQFIERMLSYIALGCSPLRLNNCFSPNFNDIDLFRNREEAGWFFLQNASLLVLEEESTIPAQWVKTRISPWSIRNQTSTAGGELQASE